MKEYGGLFLRGMAMGTADVVPGVSGGTMAFILGIYEELIGSIRAFASIDAIKLFLTVKVREILTRLPWEFLLAVGLGIFFSIATLAKTLKWTLENHPTLVWSFFFGLVLASIFTVVKKVEEWSFSRHFGVVAGTVLAYWLVGAVPLRTPETWWYLFFCGAIAICAMILPGISGSFILVLLGKYQYILGAFTSHDFTIVFWVGAGAIAGIATFAQILNWLFKRHHDLTVAVLIGFMAGSLRKIWPWKRTLEWITDRHGHVTPIVQENILPEAVDQRFVLASALTVTGFAVVLALEWLATRNEEPEVADSTP